MTILVYDAWGGSVGVNGRTPTIGGGTWIDPTLLAQTGGVYVYSADNSGLNANVRHSVAVQDARIGGIVEPMGSQAGYSTARLFLRADSTFQNGYYVECFDDGQNGPAGIKLIKLVSGTSTELGSVGYTTPQVFGSLVYLQVAGSSIKVARNGSIILEATDSTFSSAGFAGFTVNQYSDENYGHEARFQAITIETPTLDVNSPTPGRNVSNGLVATIGVGYLGSADITLITNSLVSALNATRIPVNMTKINNATVLGTGTDADKWRGSGV
jgi:hypothetical protein